MEQKTLGRISRAEQSIERPEVGTVYCTYADGHTEEKNILSALCSCIGMQNRPPAGQIVHVEPASADIENGQYESQYESLKQLVGEWRFYRDKETDTIIKLERDGRTDPPFSTERK